jgi:hypothetical protein
MAYQNDYRRGSERDEEFRRSRGNEESFGGRESGRGEYGEPYGRGYEEGSSQNYGQQDFRHQQAYGQQEFGQPRYGQQEFGQQRYGQQGYRQQGYGQQAFGRSPEGGFSGQRGEQGRYSQYGRGPEGFDRESRGYGSEFGQGTQNFGGGSTYGETQRYGESFGTVGRNRGRFTGRGPKGYIRSDDRIREDVSDRLEQHGEIDATEIEIRVSNGEVTLEGTVEDRRTKRMAEDVVENCPGVKQVHNRIRVQGNAGGQSTSSRPSTTTSATSGSTYRSPSSSPKS